MHRLTRWLPETLIALLTLVAACAANPASTGPNGRTVTAVAVGYGEEHLGEFRQVGPKAWREVSATGGDSFDFVETGRDEWSVYLHDASRNVQIQLDLHRRKVLYGERGGSMGDLYDIQSATAMSQPRVSPTPQQPPPQPSVNPTPPQPRSQPRVNATPPEPPSQPRVTPTPPPTPTQPARAPVVAAPVGLEVELLKEHNRIRADVGVGPMTWSDDVARYAQEWADQLAGRGCRMEHRQNGRYGENLYSAWSSRGAGPPGDAARSWEEEKPLYDGGPMNDKNFAAGHYTQIVWRKSQGLGCGQARCADGANIVVCNYEPAGNMDGEPAY